MSGLKRSYRNLEAASTEWEPARAKRRAASTFEIPCQSILNGASDDASAQDIMSYSFTGLPSTPAISIAGSSIQSASLPPSSPISPEADQPNRIPGDVHGESSGGRELCFGTIPDCRVKLFRSVGQSEHYTTLRSVLDGHIPLRLRFRPDSITILLPTSDEVGILDDKTIAALKLLRGVTAAIKFDAFLSRDIDSNPDDATEKKLPSILPVQVNVLGPDQYLDEVGFALSNFGVFLQEPIFLNRGLDYLNPHFLSWGGDSTTPLFLSSQENPKNDFMTRAEAILESSNAVLQSRAFMQDARVTTILRRHQVIALGFMVAREDQLESTLSLWEPLRSNHREGFIHEITHEKRSSKPYECRGGILADEMGMGKSLSLLALVMHTLDHARLSSQRCKETFIQGHEGGHPSRATLIITPKSTLYNWELEIQRHTSSDIKVFLYHGSGINAGYQDLAEYDLVLTTYETVSSDLKRKEKLQAVSWFRIVLDEAHHIRNRTRAFRAVMGLKAERRWCLTGTPVQNSLDDLFSLTEFLRYYPVENRSNARRWILDPLGTKDECGLENLRWLMTTAALRRPMSSESHRGRSDTEVIVVLSQAERKQYNSIRSKALHIARSGEDSSSQNLFSYILRMRQICSHGFSRRVVRTEVAATRRPLQGTTICQKCVDVFSLSSKPEPAINSSNGLQQCLECASEQEYIPSMTSDSISLPTGISNQSSILISEDRIHVANTTNDDDVDMDVDKMTTPSMEPSSKIESILQNLRQLEQERSHDSTPIKSLVFSFWTTTLDVLEQALRNDRMAYTRIDGGLTLEQRKKAIQRFQSEPDLRTMLLSFGSGSVGLNLTAATHVHLVEPQWNPMVEAQAAARVDRLDQERNVVILRYIVKDSIEELIKARQKRKLWLAKLSASHTSSAHEADAIHDLNELESLLE